MSKISVHSAGSLAARRVVSLAPGPNDAPGGACRGFGEVYIERARLGERDREDGAEAVNHVEPEQQRDLESRFRRGHTVDCLRVLGADHVE